MSPTDGLLKFTNKHLDRFEAALARVLATRDIEPVHELRVSSRRLSEPLELMGESLGRKKMRRLRKALGEVRGSLRHVRDIDVLRLALVDAESASVGNAEDLAKLQGLLAIHREAELSTSRKLLKQLRPAKTHDAIGATLKSYSSGLTRSREKRLVDDSARLWRRKAEALLERPPARDHAPGLHKTRLKLKALRYSTELLSRLDGENREPLLKQFAAMQDRLGAWNDHVCATAMLAQLVQNDQALAGDPEWFATVLDYAARRARLMSHELGETLILWPRLRSAVELHVFGRAPREQGDRPRDTADVLTAGGR